MDGLMINKFEPLGFTGMKITRQYVLKITLLFMAMAFFAPSSFAQDWCQQPDLPSAARKGASGFSIGDKGYVCFGDTSLPTNQLWEYDPGIDSWAQQTDFPGSGRSEGIAFSIQDTAYAGLGWDGSDTLKDMFAYMQASDSWKAITSYPGRGTRGAFGVSVNGIGYVGGGSDGTSAQNDFWSYDPSTNQWSFLGNFPFGDRIGMVAVEINGRIYAGMGYRGKQDFNDFWEYSPITNSWRKIADAPGLSRYNADAFVVNGFMIMGGGYRLNGNSQGDYYRYNPNTNKWTAISGFKDAARFLSAAFSIDDKGYLSCGSVSTGLKFVNTWEYDPDKSITIDTAICAGDTFVYKKDTIKANYLWFDGRTDSVRAFTEEGIYYVDYDFGGCTYTDTIDIEIIDPQVELGPDTFLCPQETRFLSAFNLDATYLWQDGSTDPTFLVDSAGTYFVEVNLEGCLVYDTITFTPRPNPQVDLVSDSTLCPGDTLLLDATTNGATYLWQDGSTDSTYTVDEKGFYIVQVTLNGCDTTVASNINYRKSINKPFLVDSLIICDDKDAVLDAGVIYPADYLWSDSTTEKTLEVSDSAIYWVEITTLCDTLRDSIEVKLQDCNKDSCKIDQSDIPNVFTPNEDGINDYFDFALPCQTTQFEVSIYDRWGSEVYWTNINRVFWDGRIKGRKANEGTYFYVIRYKLLESNELITKKGTLMLLH